MRCGRGSSGRWPGPRTVVAAGVLVAGAVVAVPAAADGDAGTFQRLGFDDLPPYCLFLETTALRDEYADRGIRFRGPAPDDGGGVLNVCAFFLVPGISPPNFLGFNDGANYANGGTPRDPETILFDPPVGFVEADVGSFLEAGLPIWMTAYDSAGSVVDQHAGSLEQVASPILVVADGIAWVEVEAPGARYILDDLLFGESPGGGIEVVPAALHVALEPGATASVSVTLRNTLNHDLELFLLERSPGDGLGESSAVGPATIEPMGEASGLANLVGAQGAVPLRRHQEVGDGAAPKILVYTESDPSSSTPDTELDQALRSLGLPYTSGYNGGVSSYFIPLLEQGSWDLVIFDHQAAFLYDWDLEVFDALLQYVLNGGRLVFGSWQISDRPTHPLWSALGFRWLDNYTVPEPVLWTPAEPRFFTVPNDVPEFVELQDLYVVDGQLIESLPGTTTLAVLASDPTRPALVLGNGGRTVVRAFLDGPNLADRDEDGLLDTYELWRDLLIQMLAEDVPWLATPAELVGVMSARPNENVITLSG